MKHKHHLILTSTKRIVLTKNIAVFRHLRANKTKWTNICHRNNQNHLRWSKINQGWMHAKQWMTN